MWSLNKVSLRNQSLFEVSLSINSHQISFQAMWSYSKPILLLHYCRKSENIRDFIKKYFHLNTIAVYNSSAKNYLYKQIVTFSPHASSSHHKTHMFWLSFEIETNNLTHGFRVAQYHSIIIQIKGLTSFAYWKYFFLAKSETYSQQTSVLNQSFHLRHPTHSSSPNSFVKISFVKSSHITPKIE